MSQSIKAGWDENDIPSQAGKTILITGANIGLGYEAARMVAGKKARVLMACRSEARGAAARDQILAIHRTANLDLFSLDLADLDSVAALPAALAARGVKQIDTLINNAGIMMPPKRLMTNQGYEAQFGINHLGHFALTHDLFPLLSSEARIVSVASIADRRGDINWNDIQWEENYSPTAAYGQSKPANLLFIKALSDRLAASGSKKTAIAAHPGISQTNLGAGSILRNWMWLIQIAVRLGIGPKTQSAAMGALPEVYAATGEVEPGAYYGPSERTRGHPIRAEAHRAEHSDNAESADRLWQLSEELTGRTFSIS